MASSTPAHQYTTIQSVCLAPMQGALRRQWRALVKKRNAAVALCRGARLHPTLGLFLLALPWATFAAPDRATTAAGGSQSESAQADTPEQRPLPTAGLGGSGGRNLPSPDSPGRVQGSSVLDYDGLSFYPGFANGCTASASAGLGSLAVTGPPAPERSGSRYVRASVSGAAIYTDNFRHQKNGAPEFVTQLGPRIDACQRTGRIKTSLSYELQGVVYAKHPEENAIYHDVAGDATINVIPAHVYLDLNTRYGQTITNPSLGFSGLNALTPDNQTARWSSNISPFWVQSLGPIGQETLRYRYGRTTYSDKDLPDITVNGAFINITSPDWRDTLTWKLNGVSQVVERSGGNVDRFLRNQDLPPLALPPADRETHFGSATLQLGLRVSSTVKLFLRGGVEDDYKPDGSNDQYSSPRASAGIRKDDLHYSLAANVGSRFDVLSYGLDAAFHGSTFRASVSYREDPSSQAFQAANAATLVNSGGFFAAPNLLFDRGVFIERRWAAALGFDRALFSATIRGYYSDREFQLRGIPDEVATGASIDAVHRVLPRTTINARLGWNRQFGRQSIGYDHYDARISVGRQAWPSLHVSLGYIRLWQDADGRSDFVANVVALQFTKGF